VSCPLSLMLVLAATSPMSGEPPAAAQATPPFANQLLLPRYSWDLAGSRLSVLRRSGPRELRLLNDSLTADGLAEALSLSPTAAALARQAHQELAWGHALSYSGWLGILAGAVSVTVGAAEATDGNAQVVLSAVGGTLLVAGVISVICGSIGIHSGLAHVLEAVNAYNLDLVDRPLQP
jgi:hypothetical protein